MGSGKGNAGVTLALFLLFTDVVPIAGCFLALVLPHPGMRLRAAEGLPQLYTPQLNSKARMSGKRSQKGTMMWMMSALLLSLFFKNLKYLTDC